MPSERLILDIRYYESDVENVAGASLPSGPGRIFHFPMTIHSLGARIARKMREYGFVTGTFDHLYVNYTSVLPDGDLRMSPRNPDNRIKYIDYGLRPDKVNPLSDAQKESLVASSTLDILELAAGANSAQCTLVDRIRKEIDLHGSTLEITHKTKETESYSVTVTYQIRPNGNRSVGFVEYVDKKTGDTSKAQFVKLDNYEDIFALVGSISVSRGTICLKPRSSFKASLYAEKYKVPIEIPIAELNAA